jgi:hypothetical protein
MPSKVFLQERGLKIRLREDYRKAFSLEPVYHPTVNKLRKRCAPAWAQGIAPQSPSSNFAKQNCDQPLAPHGLIADLNLLQWFTLSIILEFGRICSPGPQTGLPGASKNPHFLIFHPKGENCEYSNLL